MLLKVKEQHRIDSAKVLSSMSGFQNMLGFGWCGSIDILRSKKLYNKRYI
jgi:hypothetical protein